MDNERKDISQKEEWLDDVLGAAAPESEIGPDEIAVASAKLIHPNDMELEMIMSEHKADDITDVIEAAVAQQIDLADAAAQSEAESTPKESVEDFEKELANDIMDDSTQFFTPQVGNECSKPVADELVEEEPVYDEAPQENDEAEEFEDELPPRKGRPKKKDGYGLWGIPHLLSTVIWFPSAAILFWLFL